MLRLLWTSSVNLNDSLEQCTADFRSDLEVELTILMVGVVVKLIGSLR